MLLKYIFDIFYIIFNSKFIEPFNQSFFPAFYSHFCKKCIIQLYEIVNTIEKKKQNNIYLNYIPKIICINIINKDIFSEFSGYARKLCQRSVLVNCAKK